MDAPTFIVEITKAVAWPLSAVVLGLIFRTEIRSLLAKVKKGKLGPAEFEQAVAVLKQETPQPAPNSAPVIPGDTIRQATTDPRAAIINGWLEVQAEVEKLVSSSPEGHLVRSLDQCHCGFSITV